jgi:hypothetical protein
LKENFLLEVLAQWKQKKKKGRKTQKERKKGTKKEDRTNGLTIHRQQTANIN